LGIVLGLIFGLLFRKLRVRYAYFSTWMTGEF
jgi:hypothetical protein